MSAQRLLAWGVLTFLAVGLSRAQTVTWTGNSTANGNFSTAENWSPIAPPTTGSNLVFDTSTRLTAVIDANLSVSSLVFNASAPSYTLSNANNAVLTIGLGGLQNSSTSTQTIAGPVMFNGSTAAIVTVGTLKVTGSIANSGMPLVLSSGTLQIGDGGMAGTLGSGISNSGALVFNRSDAVSFSGGISGTGSVTQAGSGTLTLGGANSHSGTTNVQAGSLTDAGASAFSPSSTIAVKAGATLLVNANETIHGLNDLSGSGGTVTLPNPGTVLTVTGGGSQFSGAIGGAGGLTISGGAFVTLNGSNSYGGGTVIVDNNPTGSLGIPQSGLQIGTGGVTGSITGAITNNGFLSFNHSDDITYSSGISGSGSLNQLGTGTLTLGGTANTYRGPTFIGSSAGSGNLTDANDNAFSANSTVSLYGGTLKVTGNETIKGLGDLTINSVTQPGAVTIASGKTLTLAGGSTFSGSITGAGALALTSGAFETLAGANSYSGGTTIGSGAMLQVGNGGASGSLAGSIVNNGQLTVNRTGAISLSGISGAGGLTLSGGGTLTLNTTNGANTYAGATSISAGTLADGNAGAYPTSNGVFLTGGTASTLNVNFAETIGGLGGLAVSSGSTVNLGAALTINPSGLTYGGNITGAGSLTINGGGTQILAGDNTYTGGTTINSGGTLQLGSSTVNSGAAGSVAGNILNNGNLVFGRNDTIGTYAGIISGTGNVSQSGAGSMYFLNGQNTYTGSTNVNNGATLVLGGTSGVPATTVTNANVNNGTLQIRAVNALPMASSVFLSGSGLAVLDVGANQQIGRLTGQGTVNLTSGVLTIAPQTTGPLGMFSGNINGTGSLVIGGLPGSAVALAGSGSFSGGTTTNAGAVLLLATGGGNPLGSGPLTLQNTATLAPNNGDVAITNPVTVSGPTVAFGAPGRNGKIGLSGNVTLSSSATTVNLTHDQPLLVTGAQWSVPTGATVTFQSGAGDFGLALLGPGSVSGNIAAVALNNAGVAFGSASVLGAVTKMQGNGYVGVAFSTFTTGLKADFLDKIDKLNFTGTIGFDGQRDATTALTFADPIDLTGFNAGVTLGSLSGAILTGAITPQGTNYQFGNGGGFLLIQSALGDNPTTHASRGVVVNSSTSIPNNGFYAVLQGANTFTGTLSVANSAAILDSAAALPAGGQFSLGSNGYLGYTEAFTGVASFADLVATRLSPGAYTGTSVLGFDSHDGLSALTLGSGGVGPVRVVLEPLNLGSLGALYLGTATQALLSGSIVAPNSGGTLSLVALNDKAQLEIGSRLLAGNVTQVVTGSTALGDGNVTLFGANTYAGGTTLAGGRLTLGSSTRKVNGAVVAGPIGTGALTVPANATHAILLAGSGSGSVAVDNPLALASALQLGLPYTFTAGAPAAPNPATAVRSGMSGYEELTLNGVISDASGGTGRLEVYSAVVLNGANTFTGGVTLRDFAYLQLGNDSSLGSGPLVFGSQTMPYYSIWSSNGARTLANNLTFSPASAYSNVWFGGGDFTFNGSVSLGSTMVTLASSYALRFNGAISGSGRLQGSEGIVYLNGTNTYSGGTEAQSGAIVFGSAAAIPATNFLQADGGGYIGLASTSYATGQNLQSAFLNRFNKAATNGTVGLDSASAAAPNTFSDSISLVGFGSSAQLGSSSNAIVSGVITPQGSTYNFGGGGGMLQVTSALTDGGTARGVQAISPAEAPLTLVLTGANTYTGATVIQNSAVVFGAAPVGPINLQSDGSGLGYAGLQLTGSVDGTNSAVTSFLARFTSPSTTTGYVGFDSANGAALTINGLNLGSFGSGIGVATATNLTLGGTLGNATGASTYRFAGYKGGQLTVASTLSAGSVEIGNANTPATAGSPVTGGAVSTVTLNGANTYAGGTTLYTGALLFGASSTLTAGAITAGPLGTGPVTVAGGSFYSSSPVLPHSPQLGATTGGLTLANPIALNDDLTLVGGSSFTLAGNLTGYGDLIKTGTGTVTVTGSNGGFSGDVYIQQGTMVFATGNAFGTGTLGFGISTTAPTATFMASTTINGLFGDSSTDVVNVANGARLTINAADDSQYLGTFAGSGGSLAFGGPYTSSPAVLKLSGASSSFAGGTTINPGIVVVAQNSAAFGPAANSANTITLNGGKLAVGAGVTIANPLVLTSGQLGGGGTFQPPAGLAIGAHVALAPGGDGPGTLTFSGASLGTAPVLTLLGGGSYNWQLADGATAAGGFDRIVVTGTVAIDASATAANPFVFRIVPVLPTDAAGNAVSLVPANFDVSRAAQWTVLTASSITGFNANAFSVDTTAFSTGALGVGSFFVTTGAGNTSLLMNFAPVPEPSTYVLFGIGALVLAVAIRRRRAR